MDGIPGGGHASITIANPLASVACVGLLPQYRYRFASPPPNPIGSCLNHRPVIESYHRLPLFCKPVTAPVVPFLLKTLIGRPV